MHSAQYVVWRELVKNSDKILRLNWMAEFMRILLLLLLFELEITIIAISFLLW